MSQTRRPHLEPPKNSLFANKTAWKVPENVSEADPSKGKNLPAMKRYDIASGALWNMGGFGAGQLLRLASNVVLTRLLLQEAFGIMALTMVAISSVATLSDFGIRASVVQNPDAEDRQFLDTAWTLNIIRGVALFFGVCLVAIPFSRFYETPEILYLVPMVGVRILIDSATTTKLIVYRRQVKIKQLAMIELIGQVAGLIVMIPLAWHFQSVWTLVIAGLVQSSFRTIVSYVVPGKNNRLCWDKASVRKIYHFGRWILLSTALSFADASVDKLVFGKLVTLAMLGVYNIGAMMAGLAGRIVGRLTTALFFPVLSRVNEENGQIAPEYNRIRIPVVIISGWTSAILIGSGQSLMHSLYDESYAASGWIVQLLAAGLWFRCLTQMNHVALLAMGDSRWGAVLNAAKIVGLAIFIPIGWFLWEFPGAVAAISCAETFRYASSIVGIRRHNVRVFRTDLRFSAQVTGTAALGLFLSGWLQSQAWPNPIVFIVSSGVVTLTWLPQLIPAGLQFYRRHQSERGVSDSA